MVVFDAWCGSELALRIIPSKFSAFRFTELFVNELNDRTDLITLIACYLKELPAEKINAIAKFYLKVRSTAQTLLNDGTGHKPHYR